MMPVVTVQQFRQQALVVADNILKMKENRRPVMFVLIVLVCLPQKRLKIVKQVKRLEI